jgi:hypothetical protein
MTQTLANECIKFIFIQENNIDENSTIKKTVNDDQQNIFKQQQLLKGNTIVKHNGSHRRIIKI